MSDPQWPEAIQKTIKDEEDRINDLWEQIRALTETDLDAALKVSSPPEYSFAPCRGHLLEIFEVLKSISKSKGFRNLSPAVDLQMLTDYVAQVKRAVDEMSAYKPHGDADEGKWRLLHQTVRNLRHEMNGKVALLRMRLDMDDIRNGLWETYEPIDQIKEEGKGHVEDLVELKREAISLVESLKDVASGLAADKTTEFFKRAEKRYALARTSWLVGAMASLGFLTWLSFCTAGWLSSSANAPLAELLIKWSPWLFLKIVLLVAFVYCLRLFAVTSHNLAVTRHRINVLGTYELYYKAAPDEAAKRAVLEHAMNAAFAHQPTGYLKAAPEVQPIPMPFIRTPDN